MLTLKNIKGLDGNVQDYQIESASSQVIDGKGKLLLMPALIDTDVSNNFIGSSQYNQYLSYGITTLFNPQGSSIDNLRQRIQTVNGLKIYEAISGISSDDFEGIGRIASLTIGIKAPQNLLTASIDSPNYANLDRLFQIAAQQNLVVIVPLMHADGNDDEQRKTALSVIKRTIELTEKYSGQLGLQHLRTEKEISLLRQAKRHGLLVYGETVYAHLILSGDQKFSSTNIPFIPNAHDQQALWDAINDGTIELVGSGSQYMPPELMLAALLDSVNQQKVRIETVITSTSQNPDLLFDLKPNKDIVLVDMEKSLQVASAVQVEGPFAALWKDKVLTGWPVYTIADGQVFPSNI